MSKLFTQDLTHLAQRLAKQGPVKSFPTSRRVRVLFNNIYIVDTTSALHVWEHEGFPQFYIPHAELKNCTWTEVKDILPSSSDSGSSASASGNSVAAILKITVPGPKGVGERSTDRAILFHESQAKSGILAGLVRLEFGSMDKWLEEDTPIYVHPKDPFKRIDVLPSTRHVEVKLNGHTLASAQASMHLLETSLPTRYYLPLSAVDQSYLRQSDLVTKCPYKGEAEYYDIVLPDGQVYKNLVWYYRIPTAESAGVAGLVCFYNEKVDVFLDGVELERPKTHFG